MELAARILIILAAIPANLIPILYNTRPWYRSLAGRWVMLSVVGMALLIDAAILLWVVPDFPGSGILRLIVYSVVMSGLWFGLFAVIKYRRPLEPERPPLDAP